jgi:NADH-quinone oxidoreductase subunit J
MTITSALFYLFSIVLLFAGARVVTARSTVHAALYLVLAFGNAACVWLLLHAEFLAIALVLVYVGAVMVLFLFVVMMLDLNSDRFREGFWKHLPLAGLVGAVIALEMAFVLIRGFDVRSAAMAGAAGMGNTQAAWRGDPLPARCRLPRWLLVASSRRSADAAATQDSRYTASGLEGTQGRSATSCR